MKRLFRIQAIIALLSCVVLSYLLWSSVTETLNINKWEKGDLFLCTCLALVMWLIGEYIFKDVDEMDIDEN